ncbi:MAG TPA: dksa/trar family transcriptional regulator, partial [Mycobacteriales bacterium]
MTEPPAATPLSPAQRAAVEEVLAAERASATEQIDDLTRDHAGIIAASAESNADDEHDPEGATIA